MDSLSHRKSLSEKYTPTIEGGYELSMTFDVRRHATKLFLENLPSMGYKTFVIRRGRMPANVTDPVVCGADYIENDFLRAESGATARLD